MHKYNVLIYGSGAREHALAFKISQSPLLNKLFLALPNDGFKHLGEELHLEDLKGKCRDKNIDLAIIGPETPLIEGIVDELTKHGIKCIGANKKWAQLEGSKLFAKEFMEKHGIATAKYFVAKNKETKLSIPCVIKADGLCGGKGVCVCETHENAQKTLEEFLGGKFGKASETVLVEEYLEGEELSVMSLFDGKTLLSFTPARDYKKLYRGQNAPNTGGMGAFCPVELTKKQEKELQDYLKKLETALKSEKADFTGVVYSGLMLTKEGIKVLEYNMRFGDPEIQALLCHLKTDLLEILVKTSEKKISQVKLKWKEGTTVAVIVASNGYPEKPKTGCEIKGVEEACAKYDTQIFYAGTKKKNNKTISNSGRIMTICKTTKTPKQAREKIYKTIDEIDFKDKIYRKDIGL